MKKAQQLAKMRAWEADLNKKFTPLRCVCIGIHYGEKVREEKNNDPMLEKLANLKVRTCNCER